MKLRFLAAISLVCAASAGYAAITPRLDAGNPTPDEIASSKAIIQPNDTVAVNYTQAEADSCVAAFATIMASYIRPELQKQFGDDPKAREELARGIAHAFDIRNDEAPYYMGVRMGLGMIERVEGMEQMGYPVSPDVFVPAFSKALAGPVMGFDETSADAYLRRFMNIIYPPAEPLTPESQQAFLAEQKAREGVIELPGGVLFEVLTEGEGAMPGPGDSVKLTYMGALADGTVFDVTDTPVSLPVSGVVPGFSEALQQMKPGGKYRVFIPADRGYGDQGAAGVIPPGAALDFTVTLLEIEK